MILTEREESSAAGTSTAPSLYCIAAMVADEASRSGFRDFARDLEAAIAGFLASLPVEQRATALRLSYDLAMGLAEGEAASAPRLRLVYSR